MQFHVGIWLVRSTLDNLWGVWQSRHATSIRFATPKDPPFSFTMLWCPEKIIKFDLIQNGLRVQDISFLLTNMMSFKKCSCNRSNLSNLPQKPWGFQCAFEKKIKYSFEWRNSSESEISIPRSVPKACTPSQYDGKGQIRTGPENGPRWFPSFEVGRGGVRPPVLPIFSFFLNFLQQPLNGECFFWILC